MDGNEDDVGDAVPVLPVVVPLGIVVFVALVSVLLVRRRFSVPRAAVAAAVAVYAAGVVANTVFPVFLHRVGGADPGALPLVLVPFVDYEVGDAVTNVLVFLPIGVLVPLLLARPTWWRVLATAAGISVVIELTQLVTARVAGGGHVADVDDWLWNVVGAGVGFALYTLLVRLPGTDALVERFRWTPRAAVPRAR